MIYEFKTEKIDNEKNIDNKQNTDNKENKDYKANTNKISIWIIILMTIFKWFHLRKLR